MGVLLGLFSAAGLVLPKGPVIAPNPPPPPGGEGDLGQNEAKFGRSPV